MAKKFGKWSTGSLAKASSQEEYNAIMATVPKTTTATTLAEFGYHYTAEGKLRQISNGEKFAWLGQKHYDYLGDAIVRELYSMLENKYGLKRVMIPLSGPGPKIPIFVSPNYLECDDLMCIIQGSGAVRPGMWARALCINDSLETGAIFTYVEAAQKRGMAVIVFNPNENSAPDEATVKKQLAADSAVSDVESFWLSTADRDWKDEALRRSKAQVKVAGNERPQHHADYVWKNFVLPAKAKRVPIVAHSYGGKCTTAIIKENFADVAKRVPCIAFTDAINDMCVDDSALMGRGRGAPVSAAVKQMQQLLQERSCNWVGSKQKLDAPEKSWTGCKEVSAGHDTHEYTSASCFPSAIKFIDAGMSKFGWEGPATSSSSATAATAVKPTEEAGNDDDDATPSQQAANDDDLGLDQGFSVDPLDGCMHCRKVQTLPSPFDIKTACAKCGNIGENMVCLVCHEVHCGRHVKGHMLAHNEETGHPLVMGFADLSIWCYVCDNYILHKNDDLWPSYCAAHVGKFGEAPPGK